MGITMPMDVYLLYAYVGAVCAAVIAIILNRVKSTEYKETIDKMFCHALLFFIAFCIVDCVWGIIGSQFSNRTAYLISSYGFHIMAAWASFICSAYVLHHLQLSKKTIRIFEIIRYIFIAAQMILIFQNIFTGLFFTIDEDAVYHSEKLRTLSFLLQFCHYIPIIIYALIHLISKKKGEKHAYVYSSSLIFSVMPLVFGILQLLYPDGSFYSLGFLVTSVTMYAFNVTQQREAFLATDAAAKEYERSKAKIEEALKSAEAANAAKTTFLANMSHDIRTPINGIMGMVTLAKKEEMNPNLEGYVKKIDIASRHLLSLVNDVLDLSRIERGKTEIACEAADIRTIIDNCASIIRGQFEGRTLDFEVTTDSIVHPRIFIDILHIKQILINILGNAVKFTPDGGKITFEVKEISFDGETVEYEFVITDTGIGMKPEFLEHIYEAFAQESGGSRGKYQGTGLGMTITNQLVSLMNGTITIKSEQNVGSNFTVRIPFKVDNATVVEEKPKASSNVQKSISGIHILLVEDNELNMEIARSLLEDGGAVITEAWNGKEAVETFTNKPAHSFDIILMDIMMPEMNGYEATRAIRASSKEDAATIPIVAMTANAFAEDKIKAIESGMNAHTSKPIDFSVLVSEITDLLGKKTK